MAFVDRTCGAFQPARVRAPPFHPACSATSIALPTSVRCLESDRQSNCTAVNTSPVPCSGCAGCADRAEKHRLHNHAGRRFRLLVVRILVGDLRGTRGCRKPAFRAGRPASLILRGSPISEGLDFARPASSRRPGSPTPRPRTSMRRSASTAIGSLGQSRSWSATWLCLVNQDPGRPRGRVDPNRACPVENSTLSR